MGFLEEKMYSIVQTIFRDTCELIINSWKRFLDDCWIIWDDKYGELELFKSIVCNLDSSIKFTYEMNTDSLNFLDVMVTKDTVNGLISTDIYRKQTDTMSYVPFHSAHPLHVIKNIPYNLARRIKIIVSNEDTRTYRYNELKIRLLTLNYPSSLINDAIDKAKSSDVSNNNKQNKKNIFPFVHEFNRSNPDIYNKVIRAISNTLNLLTPFQNCNFMRAYKQPRSLQSILSQNNRMTISGVSKCGEPRCKCCSIIIEGNKVDFETPSGIKTFNIRKNMNCKSTNVIYKMICGICKKFYNGQTGDVFRHRLTVHRQQINDSRYCVLCVSKHITSCGGGHFSDIPFFQLSPDANRLDRESKEAMFINLFHPCLNAV